MAEAPTAIVVECPPGSEIPGWRVGGMSLCERAIREAFRAGAARVLVRAEEAQLAGLEPSLAGRVERLAPGAAAPPQARAVRGDEAAGVRVTDAATRRRAEWALLEACRRPYDGMADRYLWRALSLRITRLVARTEVTPNQVTVIAALFGLLACALVAPGGHALSAAAGAALLVGLVLDSVDGELARVRLRFSRLGMVLDNVSDDIIDTLILPACGAAAGQPWLWIGLGAAVARTFVAIVIYDGAARAGAPGDVMAFRWWFERGQETTTVYGNPLAPATLLRSLGRHDAYVTFYGAFLLAGIPFAVVVYGAVTSATYFVQACLHLALGGRRRQAP